MVVKQNNHIAHVKESANGSWETHTLEDHLISVANLAVQFSSSFGSHDWAAAAGIWHDLGKYSNDFQKYIKTASGYDPEAHVETIKGKVNHSSAGALYAVQQFGVLGRILAYLIAGHHAGLPDWYKIEGQTGGSLQTRLQNDQLLNDALAASIPDQILQIEKPSSPLLGGKDGFSLWVRMLFSCLVDADFLDTESFMDERKISQRSGYLSLKELHPVFNDFMENLTANAEPTPVNMIRKNILNECREKGRESSGTFSLTVPTGGGKTLSSMAFGLEHAIAQNKDRIIYVIPYTSIVEQTVNIFRNIFGENVVEHHSSLDPDEEDSRSRLATENWDAPIIVTTNVQFFESLFAAKTSRCRKLHNIVNSIVVLDEAQLLPPEFLQPILNTMNLLTEHYGVTFVLSTATQPALQTRYDTFDRMLVNGLKNIREIVYDPDGLYTSLERVKVHLPSDFNSHSSWSSIADELHSFESVLCIVNTRKDARELHALMPNGTIHLSALMCGQHRSNIICEIITRLKNGKPTRVISTQLVEAGVDLDFPVVYRAMAGLDSIAQAAGRCNREGKLTEKGKVVVFIPPRPAPPGHLRKAAETTVSLLTGCYDNPLNREQFQKYFESFYTKAPSLDKHEIESLLTPEGEGNDALKVQFRTAAMKFKLIDDQNARQILIRYYSDESDETVDLLLKQLENKGPSRWLMRKLQRYCVTVSEYHFKILLDDMEIFEIWSGIYAQTNKTTIYDQQLGLILPGDEIPTGSFIVGT